MSDLGSSSSVLQEVGATLDSPNSGLGGTEVSQESTVDIESSGWKPLRLRVERSVDSMIGNAQPFGLPTKFTFVTAARLWFDRRPEFNYRITAVEIEEVR